jgi:hypothetical protein
LFIGFLRFVDTFQLHASEPIINNDVRGQVGGVELSNTNPRLAVVRVKDALSISGFVFFSFSMPQPGRPEPSSERLGIGRQAGLKLF